MTVPLGRMRGGGVKWWAIIDSIISYIDELYVWIGVLDATSVITRQTTISYKIDIFRGYLYCQTSSDISHDTLTPSKYDYILIFPKNLANGGLGFYSGKAMF